MRKITVSSQPGQIVLKTLSQKNPLQKRAGGVAQGVGQVQAPIPQKKKKKNFQTAANSRSFTADTQSQGEMATVYCIAKLRWRGGLV
jgi:hypothetical protein